MIILFPLLLYSKEKIKFLMDKREASLIHPANIHQSLLASSLALSYHIIVMFSIHVLFCFSLMLL